MQNTKNTRNQLQDSAGVELKVGDRVEVLNAYGNGAYRQHVGKIGTVTSIARSPHEGTVATDLCAGSQFSYRFRKVHKVKLDSSIEPTYLTRRAELIEAIELVEEHANVYYEDNMIPAQELAALVYPEPKPPRPKTLPAHKIRVRYTGSYSNIVERLVNVGPHKYMLNAIKDGNRLDDDVFTLIHPINLDILEALLGEHCTLIDTWSPDTEFPELLECC